ncbi:MAG: hypothetical protein IKM08_03730 [Clostridia bacterium]|nr:hypothetical protein [Clostridia bacterium]
MKENKNWDFLRLFGAEDEGETQEMPVHTLQAEEPGEAADSTPVAGESTEPEAREERFRALMEGEYKDLFTAYFQETFNRRFREQKEIKEELEKSRTLVRAAAEHFGVEEHELLAAIRAEDGKKNASAASAVKSSDSAEEKPIEQILSEAVENARRETEQRLLAAIRARGLRPAESAPGGISGSALGGEAGKMSRAQRAELARRAAEGERILL